MSPEEVGDWLPRLEKLEATEALFVDGETISYSRLSQAAERAARELDGLGVEAGDLVAVLASPSAGGVALIHGLLDRRFVLLPLNLRLTEEEQAEALRQTRARFLIVGPGVDAGRAKRLSSQAGCGLIRFAPLSGPDNESGLLLDFVRVAGPIDDPLANRASLRAFLLEEDIGFVLQTSGTSGRPKAAMLTRGNLVASAEGSMQRLGCERLDRWLLCMPLFHIGGLSVLIRSVLGGTSVAVHARFDAKRVAEALDSDRVTRVSFVATMLAEVIAARGDRPSPPSLDLVLLGGGPASEDLLRRAETLGYPIAPTYGLTEAASQVATRPPSKRVDCSDSDPVDRAGGLEPLPGVEIRIVDANGECTPVGGEGEIQLRGKVVMKGYLGDPEATARAIVDGWLSTGDIGRLDGAGHLRVLDRRVDLIVSGGENIYPAEIESILADHPEVLEAGVVGRPDSKFGARPVAFVVMRPGVSFDRSELVSFCKERLAGYKIPTDFIPCERLPRTASGKLKRRELLHRE